MKNQLPTRMTNDAVENLKRLTDLAKIRGGDCLSTSYEGNKSKLDWRCAKGHKWTAIPSNILRGHWCVICGNERQGRAKAHSIELARTVAKKHGGECLS